jgi:hypothetical protein
VELAPFVWHCAQIGALPGSLFACVIMLPLHGFGECGALTPAPWQPVVFRQVIFEIPPLKSVP